MHACACSEGGPWAWPGQTGAALCSMRHACAAWAAGPQDQRLPQAVWRGSTGGFGGLAKGRAALLNLGMERPDLIDSGVLDWDADRWGEHKGRLKEKMSFGEQVLGPPFPIQTTVLRACGTPSVPTPAAPFGTMCIASACMEGVRMGKLRLRTVPAWREGVGPRPRVM